MSALYKLNSLFSRTVNIVLAQLRDLLFLPLDTLVLVTTTLLLKLVQQTVFFYVHLYNGICTALRDSEQTVQSIWSLAIQLSVTVLEDLLLVVRAEYGFLCSSSHLLSIKPLNCI
ncbi:uncharacterized protein LOC26528115 [Drosophila mojavensis]|uniref:uncharacterized protein LOC26528115 n=1 Tax=Drosophila mojavensis TaxID=7230 RepID=UPI0013EEC10B|nr:uncharacterized protein LOC26528115 [Drosophila mojavensis]